MLHKIIIYSVILFFGLIISVQDFKSHKVNVLPTLGFLLSCASVFYFKRSFCFPPVVIFLLVEAIYYLIKKAHAFGFADYIVVLAISFLIPFDSWPAFMLLCGALGTLNYIFFREKKIPFIPTILLSTLVIMIFF